MKSFVANATRLFFPYSSQSGNTAFLSSPNPPQVPVIDNSLPQKRYWEAVRQLVLSNCTSFRADEVRVISNTPIRAGGYADTWEATLNGRDVVLESYRSYEVGDIECTTRVRNYCFFAHRTVYTASQRYHTEVLAYVQLSHPNVVPFVGITSTPDHPFSLLLNAAGYVGLREYLSQNPGADKLKLVRRLPSGPPHR